MDKDLRAGIHNAVQALREQAVGDLSELVSMDSTLGSEQAAQSQVRNTYSKLGLEVDEVKIDLDALRTRPGFSPPLIDDTTGRINIVGRHHPQGTHKGRSLILNGHIDVVPAEQLSMWTRPPFEPWVDGDWLYGRGSGDMKAGIVSNYMAIQALKNLGYQPAAAVTLQSVIEEECTGNGALACLEAGYRADAAIITEPEDLHMMSGQLGVMWLQVEVSGKPAHVLNTSAGINAIEAAYAIFAGLRHIEKLWNQPENRHPAYEHHAHPINFNLGKISGGEWASSVPSHCVTDIRVGFYPDMKLEDVKKALEIRIGEVAASHPSCNGAKVQIHYRGFQAEGFTIDESEPVFSELGRAHKDVLGYDCPSFNSTATTDARFFHIYGGIPATCYGPIAENIHGIDERVSIQSMMQVIEVLAVFISRWCGLESL
ncbi:MAG: acetylornithine deacetylase [Halieaceae bacterium]|jgi:acetylornithine deacetylase